ncbi:MAG: VanW family protein [Chloroflexota bacterium]
MRIGASQTRVSGRRWPGVLASAAVIALLAGSALYGAVIGVIYDHRIYPGVTVLGVGVGGQTVDASTRWWQNRLGHYGRQSVSVRAGDLTLTLPASQLGFRPRAATVVQASYQVGRDGPLASRLLGLAIAGRSPPALAPAWDVDSTTSDQALDRIAGRADRAPVEPVLIIGQPVTFRPGVDGQTVDRAAARAAIDRYFGGLRSGPLTLPVIVEHPTATDGEVKALADRANSILSRPLTIADGAETWTIPVATVRASLSDPGIPPSLVVDSEVFSLTLASIAAGIDHPARDATLKVSAGKVQIGPDSPGRRVDQAATLDALRQTVLSGGHAARLVIATSSPKVRASDLATVASDTQRRLDQGLALTAQGTPYGLTGQQLGNLLVFTPGTSGPPTVSLDPTRLAAEIANLNRRFERPTIDTRFSWNDGKVSFLGPSRAGLVIDQKAAVSAVVAGWQSGEVALPVVESSTALGDDYLARLGPDLKGVIEDRSTTFAGSIPERAHNVSLAAQRLNGVVIPAGAPFSFNQTIGPTTLKAGFQWGFAFTTEPDGASRTIPSVAGGLCQVASTVFQPVFWAGYEIDERHYHLFWIRHYEDRGYIGLDATVSPEDGVDFKFTNDTDHALLIQAWTDDDELVHARLIGTKPDWKVQVSPEQISDVIPAPVAVLQTTSPRFTSGRVIDLEDAQTGLTSRVTRRVTYPDGHVRELDLHSIYQPANAAVLVGTG